MDKLRIGVFRFMMSKNVTDSNVIQMCLLLQEIINNTIKFQHTHIYPVYWHSAFSRACEKPVICHIVKKYPAFYGTWYFVTYYKTACHSSQCIAKLIPSTPFILISLRLNTIFSSHLYQFFPSDIMPLESNLPCTQEISFSMCTQFLSLCSEENTLVSIQTELVLIHTVRHISGRLIIIWTSCVWICFYIVHLEF